MEQIRIYHEAPLSLFDAVQKQTDGDYALVHLLDTDKVYAEKFMDVSYGQMRHIILDNSAYELGQSYSAALMAHWVDKLNPDIYIVPDAPGSYENTLDTFSDWCKNGGGKLQGEKMGVLQGGTVRECVNCFKQLKSLGADIIGIPFLIGKHLLREMALLENPLKVSNLGLAYARTRLVTILEQECEAHPIHLLGVALPQEGVNYRKKHWVVSVDTSNPIMYGMKIGKYKPGGVEDKPQGLLANHIHDDVRLGTIDDIAHNINEFRNMWRR